MGYVSVADRQTDRSFNTHDNAKRGLTEDLTIILYLGLHIDTESSPVDTVLHD